MTLDEAIKHCKEKAEEIWKANEEMPNDCKLSEGLCECANEHEQLAKWLEDYKRLLGERPKGNWEEPFESNGRKFHKCSHCHISSRVILFDNFCPNCGADMRGSQE